MHIFHSWELVRHTGVYSYMQCRKCSKRKIIGQAVGGYQPIDRTWIESGVFRPRPTSPPPKPRDYGG